MKLSLVISAALAASATASITNRLRDFLVMPLRLRATVPVITRTTPTTTVTPVQGISTPAGGAVTADATDIDMPGGLDRSGAGQPDRGTTRFSIPQSASC